MNVVILGATKGMGQALARRMAERGDRLFLLGRNADDLGAAGKDLEVRGATGEVGHAHCDLDAPEGFEVALNTAWAALELSPVSPVWYCLCAMRWSPKKQLAIQ